MTVRLRAELFTFFSSVQGPHGPLSNPFGLLVPVQAGASILFDFRSTQIAKLAESS